LAFAKAQARKMLDAPAEDLNLSHPLICPHVEIKRIVRGANFSEKNQISGF
jgi:hypothetical protein